MEMFVWLLIVLVVALAFFALHRSRAKAAASLSPEQRAKKKALEDMADNLSP